MNDEIRKLLAEVGRRANLITSYTARFHARTFFETSGTAVQGETFFRAPDRFRSIGLHDGEQYETVRIGDVVERYLPHKNELWRFDNRLMPKVEPLYSSLVDLRNPYPWGRDEEIVYQGLRVDGDDNIHVFVAEAGQPQDGTLVDAVSGRALILVRKRLDLLTEVQIDDRTALLRKLVVRKRTGRVIAEAEYATSSVNTHLDESLFRTKEPTAETKVLNFSEMLRASSDPNMMDNASSQN